MGHIIVFVVILTIAIGAAAIYQSLQLYKTYRFPTLRFYIIYLILFDSITLLNLISLYVMKNVSPLSSQSTYIIIVILLGAVGFTLAAFEVYYLTRVIWNLVDKEISVGAKIIYGTVISLWFFAFAFGVFQYFIFNNRMFLLDVHRIIVDSLSAIFFLLPLILLIMSRKIEHYKKRVAVNSFGYFYLVLSISSITILLLPYSTYMFLEVLSGLLINLFFFLFLKWFLIRFYGESHILSDQIDRLEKVSEEYHISAREKEIIEMILLGLSNKEIEQKLFISRHTVKNHIYNIFQKLGINSRGQLINFVLGFLTSRKDKLFL